MLFIETSAKTRLGVKQAFEEVVLKILENDDLLEGTAPMGASSSNRRNLGNKQNGGEGVQKSTV